MAESSSDAHLELAAALEERDYWQHRCMMEEKAKEAAFAAAGEFEKAAVAAEKEISHWKELSSSSNNKLTTAVEQATSSAREAFRERQEWQEKCLEEERRLKEEAIAGRKRAEEERIRAVDAAQKVLDAVILEADAAVRGEAMPVTILSAVDSRLIREPLPPPMMMSPPPPAAERFVAPPPHGPIMPPPPPPGSPPPMQSMLPMQTHFPSYNGQAAVAAVGPPLPPNEPESLRLESQNIHSLLDNLGPTPFPHPNTNVAASVMGHGTTAAPAMATGAAVTPPWS